MVGPQQRADRLQGLRQPRLDLALGQGLGQVLGEAGPDLGAGVGVQPPAASFGAMLFEGSGTRTFQQYPHLLLVPGAVVTLLLFAFNLLGDALNDAVRGR